METPSVGAEDAQGPRLATLPERFVALDDVVAQELAELPDPCKHLNQIEERIQEYTAFSESINAQLSARVMQNYNEFVQGMQQVQAVETELTLIGVLVKNGRRKLQERDLGLVRGSMQVARQQRKRERLARLLEALADLQGAVETDRGLRQCLQREHFCEAVLQHRSLAVALGSERAGQFPGLRGLREGLRLHLQDVQQRLSDGLRVAAVSAEFDGARYEEILRAYALLSADQARSVGKELLRHISECIVSVSRQCMLAFSAAPSHESPSEWHRKAQLRDLCRSMDPERFVACTAQLYRHLVDFLLRHRFLCQWHREREQREGPGDLHEVLREALAELSASRRNVWDRVQQQVSLVLMTLDFQHPQLNEDSFLHILHLTQLLIEEGDGFMAEHQPRQGPADGRRQFSAPIRNTLKSKAHDYFQSLHFGAWVNLKVAYLEQDGWQRLPVPRGYRLLRPERLKPPLPREREARGGNPFRGYRAEPLAPRREEEPRDDQDPDEHALLQHWIDGGESLPQGQVGSSMLSNSNSSPVASTSTTELARVLERYFRMMGAIPQLALDIFQSAIQVIEFYIYCVLCLFVQDRHLRMLLEDLEVQPGAADGRLQAKHEAFLLQRLCPDLRRAAARVRDSASTLSLPDGCAAALGVQPPSAAAALLQVTPFPKLAAPSALCGLSERCVGVESVFALLGDLRSVQSLLLGLLPKGDPQEAADRFISHQEAVAAQLRSFVLACAARDVLETPDVGRVSLDHFSSTVQALRWDGRDFSQGSPAAPYLEQLRSQLEELSHRIPCAGGGSIPHQTQRAVWAWMEVRIMHECAEVVAKCGKRKSQEALCCLAEDFQVIRSAVHENPTFGSANGAEQPLLPPDHPLAQTVAWAYLDQYMEAHGYMANEALVWCKRHPEYPLRLHRALLEYLHGGNQKVQKQHITDVETHLANHIADESAGFSQRGL